MTSPTINIHEEILDWSFDKSAWLRDALRRIVLGGALTQTDIDELVSLCKTENGLPPSDRESLIPEPLAKEHLPTSSGTSAAVSLLSVSEVHNVNALAADQALTFSASGITVIYGDNASGKSGYARILKQICRARGRELTIKPDVYSPSPSDPANAAISYTDGASDHQVTWAADRDPPAPLAVISFFDSDCALVHIAEANELAYIPRGLDLLEKLAAVCRKVQDKLAEEIRRVDTPIPAALRAHPSQRDTSVSKLINSLSASTRPDNVRSLATLSESDKARLKELPALLAQDPKSLADQARTQARRFGTLRQLLQSASDLLGADNVTSLQTASDEYVANDEAAHLAATTLFKDEPLPGIGDITWRALWQAARRFSESDAYPGQGFPVTTGDTVCVLCQQPLSDEAKQRMSRFEQFVRNDLQQAARTSQQKLQDLSSPISRLNLRTRNHHDTLSDLQSLDATLAASIRRSMVLARLTSRSIRRAVSSGNWAGLRTLPELAIPQLQAKIESLENDAKKLDFSADPNQRAQLEEELATLQDRAWLATVSDSVEAEVSRLKVVENLRKAKRDTVTTSITAKNNSLADKHVTNILRHQFADELQQLDVRKIHVEMVKSHGQYGASNYQIRLIRAPSENLKGVLSEGEHRCIALAGFLAELATAPNPSGLVLDDPVCSLDHKWREKVAHRLVDEASRRQVIVFTHDIVFLHDLLDEADSKGVRKHIQRLRVSPAGPGTVDGQLPWKTQRPLDKLDTLAKRARDARDLDAAGDEDQYHREVTDIYNALRATVEQVIEDQLFNRVVVRHRDYINITQLMKVSVLTTADCEFLKDLHSKCSNITNAHCTSTGRNPSAPPPAGLLQDIEDLDMKVRDLRSRQNAV